MRDLTRMPYMVFQAALLDDEPEHHSALAGMPRNIVVSTAESRCLALTWMPRRIRDLGLIEVSQCTALNTTDEDGNWVFVLTSERPETDAAAIDHVPDTACPVMGTVRALRSQVATITDHALRRFVQEVFALPDVFRYFWTCPASLRHHHARPGGLAQHSVDVAMRVSRAVEDNTTQRDLGIAYALMHDVGKVWAYAGGEPTPEAARLGHEQLGLERILPRLIRLREESRDLGLAMQALLSGEWRRANHGRAMAIGSVVRSADQFSAELDVARPRSRAIPPTKARNQDIHVSTNAKRN